MNLLAFSKITLESHSRWKTRWFFRLHASMTQILICNVQKSSLILHFSLNCLVSFKSVPALKRLIYIQTFARNLSGCTLPSHLLSPSSLSLLHSLILIMLNSIHFAQKTDDTMSILLPGRQQFQQYHWTVLCSDRTYWKRINWIYVPCGRMCLSG